MKELNYKIGVLKRKFGLGKGDFEPGTLINKSKEIKSNEPLSKKQVAIRGMV